MVSRQLQKFPSEKRFWWLSFYEKISYREIIQRRLKNILARKTTAHTETKRRTWIQLTLCLSYSFTVEKFIFPSFLLQWKFVESTCFLKQCNPTGYSSPREDYFPPLVIWPSLNTKIFVKACSKRQKFENFRLIQETENTVVTK